MLALILSVPPQRTQVSISTTNTRFSRRAQFIATCRGVGGLAGSVDSAVDCSAAPMPRCAGVTMARSLLCGANTPCTAGALLIAFLKPVLE
jgi:hypothetical protein